MSQCTLTAFMPFLILHAANEKHLITNQVKEAMSNDLYFYIDMKLASQNKQSSAVHHLEPVVIYSESVSGGGGEASDKLSVSDHHILEDKL